MALAGALAGAVLLVVAVASFEAAVERREASLQAPVTGVEVLDRDGALLRAFALDDGRWRLRATADDVDPRYLRMLLAWEDKRFQTHGGIDPSAFARAVWQSLRHFRIVSGGSTLTMQVARMLLDLPTRSFAAKGEQVLSALALERSRSKADILALYLSMAPYGGNLEGVRAASLAFFGKEPRRLTAAEAALLVVLPQSPERMRPDRNPGEAKRGRDRVLDRMAALGVIAPEEARRAKAEPVPTRRMDLPMLAAHAADRLHTEHPDRAQIRLTIDRALQERLETYVQVKAASLKRPLSLAILVSDHSTGEVLASVGSPDLFDASRDGFVDLTRSERSPGSALKPLIYGLAFERGIAHPETLVDDSPGGFSGYTPQNFDHDFQGIITARRALQLSRNLPAVELLSAVGPSRLISRMKRAGAAPDLSDRSIPGLAIGLGGLGLSLEDLVRIYGGLANGGLAEPLHVTMGEALPRGRRILSPQAAWEVTSILAGAATTAKGSPGLVAYKTGTSYGYRDAWTVGYDGRHVVGVWLGRPDGAPVSGLVGQDMAVPVMRDVFARIGPIEPLPGPPPGILASAGAGLPPPLKRFGRAAEKADARLRPEIAYPPNAARVELVGQGADSDLFLKVRNGEPPFTWYVDGAPIAQNLDGRQAAWRPQEPGFVEISVVDKAGAAARASVFVDLQ
ncbi:penicillin-binding protein 1C [Consotaella salsifontis]|uniref:peptidoglycan glycosyltransferase n=1 Tax=Consotaella salsifontis TaxID=1365950 RepID=A0A1T4MTP0_9HYPH|nr:penicillin-binding protein 1C [Consotaella salsifontis]SJZ70135.1 penicillin-binding protein 1C [Consotaella salsifontis]